MQKLGAYLNKNKASRGVATPRLALDGGPVPGALQVHYYFSLDCTYPIWCMPTARSKISLSCALCVCDFQTEGKLSADLRAVYLLNKRFGPERARSCREDDKQGEKHKNRTATLWGSILQSFGCPDFPQKSGCPPLLIQLFSSAYSEPTNLSPYAPTTSAIVCQFTPSLWLAISIEATFER